MLENSQATSFHPGGPLKLRDQDEGAGFGDCR